MYSYMQPATNVRVTEIYSDTRLAIYFSSFTMTAAFLCDRACKMRANLKTWIVNSFATGTETKAALLLYVPHKYRNVHTSGTLFRAWTLARCRNSFPCASERARERGEKEKHEEFMCNIFGWVAASDASRAGYCLDRSCRPNRTGVYVTKDVIFCNLHLERIIIHRILNLNPFNVVLRVHEYRNTIHPYEFFRPRLLSIVVKMPLWTHKVRF